MQIFTTQNKLISYLLPLREKYTIGFVPTMGALHKGHLSLIKNSNEKCDITICSIFINPTQFNNPSDLENYPKSLKKDLLLLKKTNCNIVYNPLISDLYPNGEKIKKFNFGSIANTMEGKYRPAHFDAMATVVENFFNIIKPTKAFFGEKDLQQLQIVKILINDMRSNVKIISVPTVREKSGLAKSSRNKMLSRSDTQKASHIYLCLTYCKKHKYKGIYNLKRYVRKEMQIQKIELEYIEMVNIKMMQPIEQWGKKNENAICVAAYISGIRLIDNIIL